MIPIREGQKGEKSSCSLVSLSFLTNDSLDIFRGKIFRKSSYLTQVNHLDALVYVHLSFLIH